jgi:hypothetical protein
VPGIRVSGSAATDKSGESQMKIKLQTKPTSVMVATIAFAFVGLLANAKSAQAQWTTGTNINNTNSGNVGIGTASPSTKLTVTDGATPYAAAATDLFQLKRGTSNGTATDGVSISLGNNSNGFRIKYGGTSDRLSFLDGGNVETLSLLNGGNVGIGTAGPFWKLSVNDATVGYNSDAGNIVITNSSDTTKRLLFGIDTSLGANGSGFIQSVKSGTGNTPLLLNANGGNVGIGTTSPLTTLHVYSTAGAALSLDGATGAQPYISFRQGGAEAGYIQYTEATTDYIRYNATAHAFTGGNVGIGTTSPVRRLTIDAASSPDLGFYTSGTERVTLRGTSGSIFQIDTAGSTRMTIDSSGNIGIGRPDPAYKLDVNGDVRISGNIAAKYQDVAEWVPSSERLTVGTVVVLDSTKSNQVISSSQSYDTRVAGVISAQPGITLGEKSDGKVLVATTGRVKVKVDASKGLIHIGDLLVTSDIAGVAMKSEPVEFAGRKMHMPGTLIGKALEPLEKGSGTILVLLSLQ